MMPSVFVNHGGGPLPLLGQQPNVASFLASYLKTLPSLPKAILIITAHWISSPRMSPSLSVSSSPTPLPLFFDYGGFPPQTYKYSVLNSGSPALSERIVNLLQFPSDGSLLPSIPVTLDARRGFDHGVFVPSLLLDPSGSVPLVSLSLDGSLDPSLHIEIGRRLSPLRSDGVLIVASGSSFHNFETFFSAEGSASRRAGVAASLSFDSWLRSVLLSSETSFDSKSMSMRQWRDEKENQSILCHPNGKDEHFTPMFVAFGAGMGDTAKAVGDDGETCPLMGGVKMSNIQWG